MGTWILSTWVHEHMGIFTLFKLCKWYQIPQRITYIKTFRGSRTPWSTLRSIDYIYIDIYIDYIYLFIHNLMERSNNETKSHVSYISNRDTLTSFKAIQ